MPLSDKVEAIKNIAVPTTKNSEEVLLNWLNIIEICDNIDPKN